MTKAPAADQLRLLDVQALDTRLAQLAHQRKSHPSLVALEELTARGKDLDRAQTLGEVKVSDIRRELTKAETDVEQVATRADRDKKRLEAGAGSAKDMQAISKEIESLARRQANLEEIQLEVMERLEAAQSDLEAIKEQSEALKVDIDKTTAERDAALADVDQQIEANTAKREVAASGLDAGLLALYDRVRAQTGGLAAVAVHGTSVDGMPITFSVSERAEIASAAPDEVLRSEDYGYILVRVAD